MLSLDDRTGNVLTTVAVFAAAAAIAFAARAVIVVVVVSLLFAYLVEPMVSVVQRLLPPNARSRSVAIAIVYVTGFLVLAGAGYALAPAIANQAQRLMAAQPDVIARVGDSGLPGRYGSLVSGAAERTARAVAAGGQQAAWLLLVPVIAVLFLNNRSALLDELVEVFARRHDRANVRRTVDKVDTMLAQYTRAQLVLAAMSFAFYGISLTLLRFPYPLVFALLGGALEFVPVIGWLTAAALMLTTGYVAHAHWIWMAGLIVIWRIVQNFVNSPRVMGDRLQMQPMTVFLALTVGGEIDGIVGIVLALPVLAVLRILTSDPGIACADASGIARCRPDSSAVDVTCPP